MKTKSMMFVLAILTVMTSIALAFSFGSGNVEAWRSDNTTSIHYWIEGADGTGTPALTCQITTPSGYVETLTLTGSAWDRNGVSHANFLYNGAERGTYRAVCFWELRGYGSLDGRHAIASTTFCR